MTSYLNTENIARSKDGVEYHPLRPFLPDNARILFLGSFPPQRKRWCMDFYYPNFINDHWRIEGQLFFGDKNHFVDLENKCFKIDEIIAFCQEKGCLRQVPGSCRTHRHPCTHPPAAPPPCYRHHRRESHRDHLCLTKHLGYSKSEHLRFRIHLPTPSLIHHPLAPTLLLSRLSAGIRQESGSLSANVQCR